ncbi:hypothetical protein ACRQ5B_09985 [Pseudarthrobacter sp. L19]|uniref:hypothetical protein n=1 Tax=Pseudarthrobacter sp. L19 TaxID=3423951 RepID=UPI003D78CDC6
MAVLDGPGLLGEGIPAGGAAAAGGQCTLDLEGRGGHTQEEASGEAFGEVADGGGVLHGHHHILVRAGAEGNGSAAENPANWRLPDISGILDELFKRSFASRSG